MTAAICSILKAANISAHKAYASAGITAKDVDLFELHDAYTILSALTLEATGFAERGEGWKLAQSNAISLTGSFPISTFGGLKARGNPWRNWYLSSSRSLSATSGKSRSESSCKCENGADSKSGWIG